MHSLTDYQNRQYADYMEVIDRDDESEDFNYLDSKTGMYRNNLTGRFVRSASTKYDIYGRKI